MKIEKEKKSKQLTRGHKILRYSAIVLLIDTIYTATGFILTLFPTFSEAIRFADSLQGVRILFMPWYIVGLIGYTISMVSGYLLFKWKKIALYLLFILIAFDLLTQLSGGTFLHVSFTLTIYIASFIVSLKYRKLLK